MSKTGVLLLVSLALNAFLLVLFAAPLTTSVSVRGAAQTASSGGDTALRGYPDRGSVESRARESKGAGGTAQSVPAAAGNLAQTVDAHMADLRRRGVDEATIRRLAVAHIEQLFGERARALLGRPRKLEYWEGVTEAVYRGFFDAEKLAAFQRLRREKLAQLRKVLGEDYAGHGSTPQSTAYVISDFNEYDYLPVDKRLALMEYLENSQRETMSPPVRLRLRLGSHEAEEAKREEGIRELLGPELFEEFYRRSSNAAVMLRQELTSFQPSRAEFDALLAIEREHGMRPDRFPGPVPLPEGKLQEVMARRTEAIRDALGEQRYADYERASDWSFRNLEQLTRELNLDAEAAQRSWSHVERARAKFARLAKTSDLRDPAARPAAESIQKELTDRLTEELGLRDYSEAERQALLGPTMNLWSQGVMRPRR